MSNVEQGMSNLEGKNNITAQKNRPVRMTVFN
jgi:hypothetical protein